eukprot:10168462-Alexandrium_andersonii.AAC.1
MRPVAHSCLQLFQLLPALLTAAHRRSQTLKAAQSCSKLLTAARSRAKLLTAAQKAAQSC